MVLAKGARFLFLFIQKEDYNYLCFSQEFIAKGNIVGTWCSTLTVKG